MIIVTVSTQRSGTKLLGTCFGSGTQIKPLGEIFNPDRIALRCYSQFLKAEGYRTLQELPADIVLDRYFAHIFHTWRPIHFDLMFNQLEIPCLSWNPFPGFFMYGYLRSRGALVISLERDVVDTYVSGKFLERTGVAHGYVADPQHAIEPLVLDANDFTNYARTVRWHQDQLHLAMANYPNFHIINYTDLAASAKLPDNLLSFIMDWASKYQLNIDRKYIQIHPSLARKTAVNYADAFSNIGEIRDIAKIQSAP